MSKTGPIVVVEDDQQEKNIYEDAFKNLKTKNAIKYFENGRTALDYLETTKDDPFIIICDINMPVMDGLDFRNRINNNPYLRRKATPFVFRTSSVTYYNYKQAYDLTAQGFFKKNHGILEDTVQIKLILDYWQENAETKEL